MTRPGERQEWGPALAERLRRQRLSEPLDGRDGYIRLFASLQPVTPVANSMPGSPPSLAHRTTFSDAAEADRLRAERTIVKGRFLGGTIGYVLSQDLDTYANAFCRPLERLSHTQQTVLDTVALQGPVTPRLIKQETGLLNKKLMPALHRLQEAFVVYEDQVDEDWERGWYDFAAEWPDVMIDKGRSDPAAAEVLRRTVSALVFATEENLRDWSGWPAGKLAGVLSGLERDGSIVPVSLEGTGEGWMLRQDSKLEPGQAPPSVFMLHRSDMLVRSHKSDLKRRFGEHEVLQYLLIDGQLLGAVLGHWRIGPHDVEDIVLELPAGERPARRDEILRAVRWGYRSPGSAILRYDGKPVS